MATPKQMYYEKRGQILVKNLQSRHFDAYYCATKEEALEKALSLIPEGSTVGWGGSVTCQQVGLLDAVRAGNFKPLDRDTCKTPQEREELMRQALLSDTFLTSANADEVIQRRLLEKKEDAQAILCKEYDKQKNIIKSLFNFGDQSQFKNNYKNDEQFARCFPFMDYQFNLLQASIIELSKNNAFSGKQQSVGERSMLTITQEYVHVLHATRQPTLCCVR